MKIKHNIVISLGICLLLLTACSKKEIEEDVNIINPTVETKAALLAEKQVNISTPVYIDIKDISGGVDYFDYIYMIRTSNDKKLAYCIKSDYSYDITDESAYNSWKEKNADLFVNYTK